ncbi:MAG: hypothetical protein ABF242_09460 [Flavobacteriales bacterium]
MEEREEEHTDLQNEGMREMMTHILHTAWGAVEVADEMEPTEYDWYVSTIIKIFEKGKHTLDVGNFLMEQETKLKEQSGNRDNNHDIANKLSFVYHKKNTKNWDKED